MFDAVRRWKDKIFRKKKGEPEKKQAQVKKSVKKEVHKQSERHGRIFTTKQIGGFKRLRKRRAKNKVARRSRQINRRRMKK
jgi:hypothetical protein